MRFRNAKKIIVTSPTGEVVEVDDALGAGYEERLRSRLYKAYSRMCKKYNTPYQFGKWRIKSDKGFEISIIPLK